MNVSHCSNCRGSVDLIDIHNDYQVRQWTEILDVTADQLTDAVRAVGTVASKVRRYVRERNTPSASAVAPGRDALGHSRLDPWRWDS
jgi:hypothetical protein